MKIATAALLSLLTASAAMAQAEVVVASDNFNRADETPLVVGGNWQRFALGGVANLALNDIGGASGDALYYWQGAGVFDNARQFSRVKVTNASGQVGLVLLGASDQGLVAAWHAGTLYIYSYRGGAYQGNLSTTSSTLQNGDVIEASLDGGMISAKVNGVVVATVANTSNLTAGRPGFETFESGGALDDWAGGIPAGPNQGECAGAPDGTPCGEAEACTHQGTCQNGSCVPGEPIVCTPSDSCHVAGVCDPATGQCSNPPIDCGDGNACTTDSCDPTRGCVHQSVARNCDDGNPCTVDTCAPAGGCLHTGIDGPDNSCGSVTDSSLCSLPSGSCSFQLLVMQDPHLTSLDELRINASNPGQIFYNVFKAGTAGAAFNLDIRVPFPFVTQGGHPIQAFGSVDASNGCFEPESALQGLTITTDAGSTANSGFPVILLSDYGARNLGSTTTIHVSGHVPATGLVYVTIHLDYGLKKTTGWLRDSDGPAVKGPDTNADGTPDGLGSGPITVASPQAYGFGFSSGGNTHASTPSSCNRFQGKAKKGPNGFAR
jgi:hypothetical protein